MPGLPAHIALRPAIARFERCAIKAMDCEHDCRQWKQRRDSAAPSPHR
jgi:hypothetical protein